MNAFGFWGKTAALVRKDLLTEFRARDTLPPMLAFALAVVLLLAFTLPDPADLEAPVRVPFGTVALGDVIAGFLWVTVLFAGLIGFARSFEHEREEGALDSLLLAPLDRSGLYLAKAAANLVYLLALEALLVPGFAVLFGVDLGEVWGGLLLVVVLADLGFVAVGTLFAALAAQTRSRELILPILALPALVPVFVAATELSSDLFLGLGVADVAGRGWFGILIFFDLIFGIVGALAFEFALD